MMINNCASFLTLWVLCSTIGSSIIVSATATATAAFVVVGPSTSSTTTTTTTTTTKKTTTSSSSSAVFVSDLGWGRRLMTTAGTSSWSSSSSSSWSSRSSTALGGSIRSGDTVLVVGGTGGVGQLVTRKLRSRGYGVRVGTRDEERGRETVDDDQVEIVPLDLLFEGDDDDENASSGTSSTLESALDGVSAVVISVGTTAFPTMKWRGGNTPEAVDKIAVTRIAEAVGKKNSDGGGGGGGAVRRIVLVTSVGVDRTDEMPFAFLNLFGVLDAKRAGEDAVKRVVVASSSSSSSSERDDDFSSSLDYVIVRPGRLVGGPYTNLDLARLMRIEGGAENGVTVEAGDCLLGDCKRDACAEAIVQCLTNEAGGNLDFSILSNDDEALTEEQWTEAFRRMKS